MKLKSISLLNIFVYIFEMLSKSSKSLKGMVCGQVRVASEFKREPGLYSYIDVPGKYKLD